MLAVSSVRWEVAGETNLVTHRIGILLHDFSAGGTERVALRLAGEWARTGRDVTIICGDPTGPLSTMVPPGIVLTSPLRPLRRSWRSRHRLGSFAGRVCGSQGISCLFVPGNFHFAALPAIRASAPHDMRLIVKLSNPMARLDRGPARRTLACARAAKNLRHADALVAMSPSLADDVRPATGRVRLQIIDEPILDDDLPLVEERPEHRTGIVSAGRFVWQKDFALAVRAFALAKSSALHLTVLGDGPGRAALRSLAVRLGVAEGVSLPGRVDDIRPWLKRSKVFLMSSRFEGFPAVAIEALAAGARLVITDCTPAVREIVGLGDVGEMVPTRNPSDIADALRRQLSSGPVPPGVIAGLHSRFSLRRSAQRYLHLIDTL